RLTVVVGSGGPAALRSAPSELWSLGPGTPTVQSANGHVRDRSIGGDVTKKLAGAPTTRAALRPATSPGGPSSRNRLRCDIHRFLHRATAMRSVTDEAMPVLPAPPPPDSVYRRSRSMSYGD